MPYVKGVNSDLVYTEGNTIVDVVYIQGEHNCGCSKYRGGNSIVDVVCSWKITHL